MRSVVHNDNDSVVPVPNYNDNDSVVPVRCRSVAFRCPLRQSRNEGSCSQRNCCSVVSNDSVVPIVPNGTTTERGFLFPTELLFPTTVLFLFPTTTTTTVLFLSLSFCLRCVVRCVSLGTLVPFRCVPLSFRCVPFRWGRGVEISGGGHWVPFPAFIVFPYLEEYMTIRGVEVVFSCFGVVGCVCLVWLCFCCFCFFCQL